MLFRASQPQRALELELARRDIPFVKFGGLKFLEAAHVKDVLAVLRWAENPRDRLAGFRVLQLLPGIGPATAGALLDALATAAIRARAAARCRPPPRGARRTGTAFAELHFARCARPSPGWPAELDCVGRWYEPHLDALLRRRRRRGRPTSTQLEHIAADVSVARALPHRADARSARARPATRRARRGWTRTT